MANEQDSKWKLSDTPASILGRALLSGDLVELADTLALNTPPAMDWNSTGTSMHINIMKIDVSKNISVFLNAWVYLLYHA